jgi:hypothetical protein
MTAFLPELFTAEVAETAETAQILIRRKAKRRTTIIGQNNRVLVKVAYES